MTDDKKKVLFIEDDDFLRGLVVTKLQKNDFHIATSSDGKNALDMIIQEQPDILLLDLMLPAISGFEILKQVREKDETKSLKVIIFSNLGDEEDIKRGQELGANEYLVKANFTLDELVEKIKEMVL